jgi:hypothetical protein
MKTVRRTLTILPFLLVSFALHVPAQQPPPRDSPAWGGTDVVVHYVGRSEFSPRETFPYEEEVGRYAMVPLGTFGASLNLPSGALLTFLELDYCDTVGTPAVFVFLQVCDHLRDDCELYGLVNSNNGSSGCASGLANLTPDNLVIDKSQYLYELIGSTQSGTPENQLIGAHVGYKLQVSPAPVSATFADVPTSHLFFRFVEALAASGITAGCGGGNFCPDQALTRGEMAVFLAAALGLHFPN